MPPDTAALLGRYGPSMLPEAGRPASIEWFVCWWRWAERAADADEGAGRSAGMEAAVAAGAAGVTAPVRSCSARDSASLTSSPRPLFCAWFAALSASSSAACPKPKPGWMTRQRRPPAPASTCTRECAGAFSARPSGAALVQLALVQHAFVAVIAREIRRSSVADGAVARTQSFDTGRRPHRRRKPAPHRRRSASVRRTLSILRPLVLGSGRVADWAWAGRDASLLAASGEGGTSFWCHSDSDVLPPVVAQLERAKMSSCLLRLSSRRQQLPTSKRRMNCCST